MAAFAELEGEVLVDFVAQAIERIDEAVRRGVADVRRVIDIGSGPGIATGWLAQRFETATVVAVDGSAAMLERVTARAARLGLADRITPHRTDLPDGLEALAPADVVWASMVLHHVGDERDALGRIRSILRPGGLLAVVERAEPLSVLPAHGADELSDTWARLDDAWTKWFDDMRADLPGAATSGAYPSMLEDAGFEVVTNELLTVDLDAPLASQARRFADMQLQRTRAQLERHADRADLEAIDALLIESGLRIHATRRLYLARATAGVPPPRRG